MGNRLATAEVQLAAVYSRQDRKNRFTNKKERDTWITTEIGNIRSTLTAQTKEVRYWTGEHSMRWMVLP